MNGSNVDLYVPLYSPSKILSGKRRAPSSEDDGMSDGISARGSDSDNSLAQDSDDDYGDDEDVVVVVRSVRGGRTTPKRKRATPNTVRGRNVRVLLRWSVAQCSLC